MNNRLTLFKVNVKLYVLYCYMNYSCYTKVSPTVNSAVASVHGNLELFSSTPVLRLSSLLTDCCLASQHLGFK